jgi:hypothetical protein
VNTNINSIGLFKKFQEVKKGLKKEEAIQLLKDFYTFENDTAPEDLRKKKPKVHPNTS